MKAMATTRTADEASPSSSSPSSKHWTYDVFLSFRGEDTRLGFTDNLYMTLKEAGINTFLDDTELRRGENIAEELMRAIQQSKISVIIFSRKYVESRWCLEELVKILECRRTLRQTVLPIFYDVDPSDVRKQTGTLAEAFDQKHKDKDEDKVKRWRAALTEAANLSGWDLRNAADGHEGLFVRKIRDEITRHLLNRTPLHVAEHQVGIDSRMQDIIFHLGVGILDDVRMVGIWGMGGIGKTLVSKAVYNHIFRSFEASSFLANVRETSKESKDSGIEVLIQRCLVTVSEANEMGMHDLIRDMGRAIVWSKSPQDPGKRCGLSDDADATDVLRDKSGSEAIEGLTLKMLTSDAKASFSTKAFSKMKRLRLLKLNHVQLSGGYKFFSNKLRWLCWHGFPLKSVPKDFSLQNVVAMDLQYSKLIHLWEDSRLVEKLKILNVSHSHYLSHLPDLSRLPNLENFVLEDCINLSEVHQSIGHLDRLSSVNLKGCIMLKDLPRSFYQIKSMRTLVLADCTRFEKLDDDLGNMGSLITLDAGNTAIRKIPSSIVRLKNLVQFSLRGLEPNRPTIVFPPSLRGLNCLTELSLTGCSLGDDSVDLGSLYSLRMLLLAGNSFQSLPSLSGLLKLWYLDLYHCHSLHAIPDLPTSLTSLIADNCPALERLPDLSKLSLKKLYISDSTKLTEIWGFDKVLYSLLNSLEVLRMEGCTTLTTTLRDSLLQKWNHIGAGDGIFLPGNDIPEWFTVVCEGDTGFFLVPPLTGRDVIAFTLCVAYSPAVDRLATSATSLSFDGFYVTNHTKQARFYHPSASSFFVTRGVDYLWLGHIPNNDLSLEAGDLFEVFVQVGSAFLSVSPVEVNKIGLKLVWSDNRTDFRGLHDDQHRPCPLPYSSLPYVLCRSVNEIDSL